MSYFWNAVYGRIQYGFKYARKGDVNAAYFYEALGFVLGGLVFSYGLVLLNEFQTSAILIFLNFAVVLILLFFEKVAGEEIFLYGRNGSRLCWALFVFCFQNN